MLASVCHPLTTYAPCCAAPSSCSRKFGLPKPPSNTTMKHKRVEYYCAYNAGTNIIDTDVIWVVTPDDEVFVGNYLEDSLRKSSLDAHYLRSTTDECETPVNVRINKSFLRKHFPNIPPII